MVNPYSPLDSNEQDAHYSNSDAGYSRIYASGEAHFFDVQQTGIAALYNNNIEVTGVTSGIFDRRGLLSDFSSGPQSRNYAITNFNSFNPYRHYVATNTSPVTAGQDNAFKINISGLLLKSTYNFNIYSTSFRTSATTPPPSRRT